MSKLYVGGKVTVMTPGGRAVGAILKAVYEGERGKQARVEWILDGGEGIVDVKDLRAPRRPKA